MIRLLYSTLFALCMPFVFLKLLWRGFKAPEYRARRFERFGVFKTPRLNHSIWFHTVSVGELLAAEPIIRQIQSRFPDRSVVVTTMTPTSSELLYKLFGDSVFHVYAPYDLPVCVLAFLRKVQPEFLVIMETELWPNMIHKASLRGCPVVVANARLSERSAKGYRRLRPAIGWMLNGLSLVLCQYRNDAERFQSLGIEASKIHVTGSVKYDIDISPEVRDEGERLRSALDPGQRVWIAASTHEGEDLRLLQVHARLREHFKDLVLMIVPRHPERFENVWSMARQQGFLCHRRTVHSCPQPETQVFLVDTMGEMMAFYGAADIAFIGGSLVEVGGHNPIEPAALAKPIVMGPHVFNFEAISEQLQMAEGMKLVGDDEGLEQALREWLSDLDEARRVGANAAEVVAQGRGAVTRVVNHLAPLIK